MTANKKIHLSLNASYAIIASFSIIALLLASYFLLEPTISRGQASDSSTFYVRQNITDESSFLVNPTNVAMNGSISGITGGNATGTTQFVVISNNATGLLFSTM